MFSFIDEEGEKKPRLCLWLLWASDTACKDKMSIAKLGFQNCISLNVLVIGEGKSVPDPLFSSNVFPLTFFLT